MKKIFALVSLLVALTFSAMAQTFNIESLQNDPSKALVHQDGFWNLYDYQFVDGEKVSFKNLNEILWTVLGNESVMKKEKGFRVADYSLLGLAVASCGVNLVYNLWGDDWAYSDQIKTISGLTCLGSLLGSFFCGEISLGYRQKAVDNYNLYVLGVPVK